MAQVINTNVASLFGQHALIKSNQALQTAMQRLSSGLRINSAQDDPTGLVTAAGYDSTIRGANMAIRGVNDGISKAQINDGYHQQILENLQRLYEIAVQSNGTLTSQTEATALVAENNRLIGLAANDVAVVNISNGTTTSAVYGNKATLAVTATSTTAQITTDIDAVTAARAGYGADIAELQSVAANLGVQSVNTSAAYSRIMDTDYAVETTNMTRNQILQQAGTAMLAQANQIPNSVLTLLK